MSDERGRDWADAEAVPTTSLGSRNTMTASIRVGAIALALAACDKINSCIGSEAPSAGHSQNCDGPNCPVVNISGGQNNLYFGGGSGAPGTPTPTGPTGPSTPASGGAPSSPAGGSPERTRQRSERSFPKQQTAVGRQHYTPGTFYEAGTKKPVHFFDLPAEGRLQFLITKQGGEVLKIALPGDPTLRIKIEIDGKAHQFEARNLQTEPLDVPSGGVVTVPLNLPEGTHEVVVHGVGYPSMASIIGSAQLDAPDVIAAPDVPVKLDEPGTFEMRCRPDFTGDRTMVIEDQNRVPVPKFNDYELTWLPDQHNKPQTGVRYTRAPFVYETTQPIAYGYESPEHGDGMGPCNFDRKVPPYRAQGKAFRMNVNPGNIGASELPEGFTDMTCQQFGNNAICYDERTGQAVGRHLYGKETRSYFMADYND